MGAISGATNKMQKNTTTNFFKNAKECGLRKFTASKFETHTKQNEVFGGAASSGRLTQKC